MEGKSRSQEAAKYFELPKRVILLALNFPVPQGLNASTLNAPIAIGWGLPLPSSWQAKVLMGPSPQETLHLLTRGLRFRYLLERPSRDLMEIYPGAVELDAVDLPLLPGPLPL